MTMQRLVAAFGAIRLQDVVEHLRNRALLDPDGDDELSTSFLVADDVPMEVWNQFARRRALPMDLRLRQLVWAENAVWIVEAPITAEHDATAQEISSMVSAESRNTISNIGQALIQTPGQPANAPDAQFIPLRHLPGVVVPNNLTFPRREWTTFIVEVLYSQSWPSVHPKVNAYRQRPGVEYILCVHLSPQLNGWSYELYDVRNGIPALGAFANRIRFDVRRVNPNAHNFHVVLDSWRVLGFPQHAQLPLGVPLTINLDMVALALHVRRVREP